nr:Tyrosine-specific transport protein [Chlamydiota bacterium]
MDKQGSVLGGSLLVAGSCIGAGMLALPIVTGMVGFFPSFIMFIVAWLFMTTTALLIVEVLGWFKEPVNMISMVGHFL